MTMLFNSSQYQQPLRQSYECDWDSVKYDPAWDKLNDVSEIQQNVKPLENSDEKVSAVVEHSTVVEVLEDEVEGVEGVEGVEISSNQKISQTQTLDSKHRNNPKSKIQNPKSNDCSNPAHFGEVPRKLDSNGNPTVFWDESIEPPEPDDFDNLTEYEEAWQKWETENSDSSICVAESAQVSPLVESSPGESSSADCAKSMIFVKKDCAIASPTFQSTTMSGNSQKSPESISSPRHHRANPLPLKASAWVEPISEIVSPQYCESLPESNLNFSVSKTSPDCYRHPNTLEKNPEHISNRCSGSFASVGTMLHGLLSEHRGLKLSGEAKGSYLLPRPGALSKSSKSSRPPGTTKSEAKAKKLGLIGKNEVYNPEWLEQEFGLPIGWTDPQECRAATELLERVEQPLETVSTLDLPRSVT